MFAVRSMAKASMPAAKKMVTPIVCIPKRFSHAEYSHYTPKEEVEKRIMKLLTSYPSIPADKVTPTAHFTKDLGLDSLSTVEVSWRVTLS